MAVRWMPPPLPAAHHSMGGLLQLPPPPDVWGNIVIAQGSPPPPPPPPDTPSTPPPPPPLPPPSQQHVEWTSQSQDSTTGGEWKQYICPREQLDCCSEEQGLDKWWWCESTEDWFLERDPGEWSKYKDPDSMMDYWYKSAELWFFVA